MYEQVYPVPQGPVQPAGPSHFLPVTSAEVTSKGLPLRGRPQTFFEVQPSRIITVPIAEVVSRTILQGRPQLDLTVRLPFWFPFQAPVVIPPTPVMIPRGLFQLALVVVGQPRIVNNPLIELTSRTTLQAKGLRETAPLVIGSPVLFRMAIAAGGSSDLYEMRHNHYLT